MYGNILDVAQKYAKSVFDISLEQNNIDYWKKNLLLFSIISQDNVIRSLCFKLLSFDKLSNIFISICEDYRHVKLDVLSYNLIYIIAENNRILLFPIISDKFNELYHIYMNIAMIKVISARKLNDDQLRKISTVMTQYLSKVVKIQCIINKSILAGILICVGDTVIDGSLSGRMFRLGKILQL